MDLPEFSLAGKVALITGGSRGIGEATAKVLARAGADVAVTSRKLPDLERVADDVRALGRRALAVECHVGRIEQLEPLVERVVSELGRIDILVNNAGTSFFAPAIEMTEKAWDTVMNLDLKGLFFLSQAAARRMRDQGSGGSIVNISSVAGYKPQLLSGHYSIAKAAVVMATQVMAAEWAQFGIRANCIAPGAVETKLYGAIYDLLPKEQAEAQREQTRNRIPLRRVGEPEEIAMGVLYLASSASSYMTGQTFAIDGGSLLGGSFVQ
jgi:NAD(P)-dependent dehydrogenase (short-subunit alcohol dehydrogenase family)